MNSDRAILGLTTESEPCYRQRFNIEVQFAEMEGIYSVTPEMLGLTWPRLLRMAAGRSVLYLLVAILLSLLLNGHWPISIGSALAGSLLDFALTFTIRFHASTRLRVTDDAIEEIDGPVIRKNEIVALIEHGEGECHGIEIVGRRRPSWLPNYRIFVPTSLPQSDELRKLVYGWKEAEEHLRVTSVALSYRLW
jgi:hypothetical protein